MKKIAVLFFAVVFLFISSVVICSAAPAKGEPAKTEKAKELFEKKCSTCHGIKKPTSVQKSKDEWNTTVQRMKGKKNSNITDEDAKIITEYLSENYGKKK